MTEPVDTCRELFCRISEGDEKAFSKLFHYYNSRIFHNVLRILKSEQDAREVSQELFLKLWLQREQLPAIESPEAWLYKIAAHLSLDSLRKKANRHKHTFAAAASISEPEDDALIQLDTKYLKQQIEEAKNLLPASRRQVFILSREEGMSRSEIARQLGISESTVKNQLTTALKFIQSHLQKHTGIYLPAALVLILY